MQIYIYDMADEYAKKRISKFKNAAKKDISSKYSADVRCMIAEMIVEKTRKHDVVIRKNPPISEILTTAPPGVHVAQEMFEAVSEILARIIALDIKP